MCIKRRSTQKSSSKPNAFACGKAAGLPSSKGANSTLETAATLLRLSREGFFLTEPNLSLVKSFFFLMYSKSSAPHKWREPDIRPNITRAGRTSNQVYRFASTFGGDANMTEHGRRLRY